MHNSHTITPVSSFHGLGIAPGLLEVLERLGYVTPTPIQAQAIPVAIQGKDIVGIAQTGTGKTLAFGIPMIQRLAQVKGRGLVMLPTRELAIQVDEVFKSLGRSLGLRMALLIGGQSIKPQRDALQQNPHVIIGTPGRIIDHLNQRTVVLDSIKIAVLDEADRMLDMGFAPQIQRIFKAFPRARQTMLFSATMPPEIMKLATTYLELPIQIEVAPSGTIAEQVTQEIFIVPKDMKTRLLEKLLGNSLGPALIFLRTKYGAKRLVHMVRAMGYSAAEIHSNRSLAQRRDAFEGFKSGKYRVLVATDIASRGIDVAGIENVINYDLPTTAEDYVHRIGRTARAGAGGHAISFATPEEQREIRGIERFIKKAIPVSILPEMPPERHIPPPPRSRHNSYSAHPGIRRHSRR
ncbi:MAG: ATP-dependent RNA helicase RhlE [Parcubacteria group bacterium Gr01-1014_66]|nr:MAG: ATP-dependent RNA helicase RhlE [Parcubacteria group bacterium Gr01-1014_66]